MRVEVIEKGESRVRIGRGWVVLTLALAAWGAVALIVAAVWLLVKLAGG